MTKKLTELIKEAMQYADNRKDIGELYKPYEEYIAEYLIDNNTIVTPCKVGDMVYEIGFGKLSGQKNIKQSKVTAIKITDKLTITLDYTSNLCDTDIGRWLFVGDNAKEEAEKALKGEGK